MLKNYFIIAWRNIVKTRFYSLVNIAGLSAGIAFTLLIGAYVWSEFRVNSDLKNADRQYIIQSKWKDPNMGYPLTTLAPLAKELHEQYPGLVTNYYRFDGITSTVSSGDKYFREGLQVGDSTMLDMYGFTLKYGDASTALKDPSSVVITKAMAKKYFGREDVVGQPITIENFSGSKKDFMITGVLNDYTKNSATWLTDNNNNQFFLPFSSMTFFGRDASWNNAFIVSYIELAKGISPKQLEQPIKQLIKSNTAAAISDNITSYAVPLKEYYLTMFDGVVQKMIYALSFIALFILLMAVVNFVNMSVSRSATRLKEIGIRKVLGGLKKQLIAQFLAESIMLVLIATVFALIIYVCTGNYFGSILGKKIPSLTEFPLWFISLPFALAFFTGIVAGIYPAFILSSLKSVDSLKGKLKTVNEKIWLRKSLVGFQFGIAAIAFIGAIIISQQVNYFFSKDLGYNKDYIISAQVPRDWSPAGVQKKETIRRQFENMPQVKNVSLSFEVPDGNNGGQAPLYKYGSDSTQTIAAQVLQSDENYADVYQIPIQAGSFFGGNRTDSGKVIINEATVHALGWSSNQEAINKQIRVPGDPTVFTVKGVTGNFHFGSMQQQVPPIIFFNVEFAPFYRYFSFKLKPGDINASITAVQKQWNALMPGAPFEYKFMDETLKNLYKTEIQLKQAAYTATILALIIVLLGVIGLVALNVQKRIKEIGIRKVLGSSVAAIIMLFIKEFVFIIVPAGLIACPAAYFIMHGWLNEYAYKISITISPFIISVIVLAAITAVLIALQTAKAALANPVKALRTE